jgi:hypothetical protein
MKTWILARAIEAINLTIFFGCIGWLVWEAVK